MAEPEIRVVMGAEVRKLELRPEDTLVVTVSRKLTMAIGALIRDAVREQTGHQRVLVLDEGMDVTMVRPGDEG
jgi:hypothetical protein